MDEIVAELLAKANALGVWLLKGDAAVAAATRDSSVALPRVPDGEAYCVVDEKTNVHVLPIRGLTLVVLYDDQSSLGLVRLRVLQARGAIERELDAGRWF